MIRTHFRSTPDPQLGDPSLQNIRSSCDVAGDNVAQVLL